MVGLSLWGSVTSLLPPHLSPRPFLDGIFKRIDEDCLGNCLLVHFIFGISRDHLLMNVLFFASPAFSLSRVHCGLSSVAQVSLLDKVRHQLSEKGECCSLVTSCFFPEVISLDLEHHVSDHGGMLLAIRNITYLTWILKKKKNYCKDGSFSLHLSSVNGPSLIIFARFRSGVSYLDAFEN